MAPTGQAQNRKRPAAATFNLSSSKRRNQKEIRVLHSSPFPLFPPLQWGKHNGGGERGRGIEVCPTIEHSLGGGFHPATCRRIHQQLPFIIPPHILALHPDLLQHALRGDILFIH